MTANDHTTTPSATRWLSGLAADDLGQSDDRPALVLLHGLTFDRSTWRPVIAELSRIDPGRRVLALDLPGHGASSASSSYAMEEVADRVHQAVDEAGIESPVVVGHSLSAIVATMYATRHPTSGVVNVDQSLQTEPFVAFLRSMADKLRGPAFPAVWEMLLGGMHLELLPASAEALVRSACNPRQDLVLGYWRDGMEAAPGEIAAAAQAGMGALRTGGLPYLIVAGEEPDPQYRGWLKDALPQARIVVWPRSGHFPHLAHPDLFAECLATTGGWGDGRAVDASATSTPM
jgi:pimeloyl-ACP methyl ester carboxylesterase